MNKIVLILLLLAVIFIEVWIFFGMSFEIVGLILLGFMLICGLTCILYEN